MANIASSITKMNDVEISDDSPISVATLTKFAANLNGLIDAVQGLGLYEFNANTNWVAPAGITKAILFGCGGGAPSVIVGASGDQYPGNGAPLSVRAVSLVPGTIYTVTIGANGAASTFGTLASHPGGSGSAYPTGAFGVAAANTGGGGIPASGSAIPGYSGKIILVYHLTAV